MVPCRDHRVAGRTGSGSGRQHDRQVGGIRRGAVWWCNPSWNYTDRKSPDHSGTEAIRRAERDGYQLLASGRSTEQRKDRMSRRLKIEKRSTPKTTNSCRKPTMRYSRHGLRTPQTSHHTTVRIYIHNHPTVKFRCQLNYYQSVDPRGMNGLVHQLNITQTWRLHRLLSSFLKHSCSRGNAELSCHLIIQRQLLKKLLNYTGFHSTYINTKRSTCCTCII